jgi:hypothetical protein
MTTLATLFLYFVAFIVLAGTADMATMQLFATVALGLSVGSGAQWIRDNR